MHCMSNVGFYLAFLHFSNFSTDIGCIAQPRASGITFDFILLYANEQHLLHEYIRPFKIYKSNYSSVI